ncbi:MAG: glycoside hydrolase family 20 zincin-like fold domain-containing protein [Victivallaceae bacterium]|nr:glycoside hydrolase family 20 zincin-like fold domain-containing protein [Victivallaceae bacterium]
MKRLVIGLAFAMLAAYSAAAEDYFVNASKRGLKISAPGMNISFLSQVISATADWQVSFYSVTAPMKYENTSERQSAAMVTDKPNKDFNLNTYRADVRKDGVYLEMSGTLLAGSEQFLEYTVMMSPVELLAGAKYTAQLADGSTATGTIPKVFTAQEVVYYFTGATAATFETRFGTLAVDVLEGAPFRLGDRRFIKFENNDGFWFGVDGVKLTKDTPEKSVIRVSFEPAVKVEPAKIAAIDPAAKPEITVDPTLVMPAAPQQRLMLPAVKQLTSTGGNYAPEKGEMVLNVGDAELDRFDRAVKRVLGKQGGIDLSKLTLKVFVNSESPVNGNSEGYTLSVTPQGVVIRSATARGAFYGLQTLLNLYNPVSGNFPCVEITDWPDMAYRGAMFLVDDYSTVFHKNLIELVLAPTKYNEIIMECEYAAWDTTKAIHREHAISKEQIKELIAVANDNYIDVSPLFQTLGHCEWLFGEKADQNLDWAEDPAFPYAYNVSAPGLYDYMDATLDEIVETFNNPKYLHIGHDEVFFFKDAKFPNRPENVKKGAKQLIYDDIMHYYDYAKRHNMRLMMWHDMFATKTECPENGFGGKPHYTAELRKDLPKDIIIVDWRYDGTYEKYPDVDAFRKDGFDVLGATWYANGNHEHLTSAVASSGGMGMLQTIWNGYFGNRNVLYGGFYQVAPYAKQGSWCWNTRQEGNDYNWYEVTSRLLEPLRVLPAGSGSTVRLGSLANIAVTAEDNPFMNFGDTFGIEKMLLSDNNNLRIGQVEFAMTGEQSLRAMTVFSDRNPKAPRQVVVPLNNLEASRIFFLHTTADPKLERFEPVVKCTAVYADGSLAEVPINNYSQIQYPADEDNFVLGPANSVRLNGNKVWYGVWNNPSPRQPVSALIFEAAEVPHSYYLFSISAEK